MAWVPRFLLVAAALSSLLMATPAPAFAQAGDSLITDAREAWRKRDRSRLAALRQQAAAAQHPLAPWVEYWELNARLGEANADEVEAFFARWPDSYVEDRLRNDWLLELGRRRDWARVARELPRFRMNDDREVTCYGLVAEHVAGRDVRQAGRAAWFAQRDLDDGCQFLASALTDARQLTHDDHWLRARLTAEANRPRAARAAAGLVNAQSGREIGDALDNPMVFLRRHAGAVEARNTLELVTIALVRVAANEPDVAARLMDERWGSALGGERAAFVWAAIGRQAAQKLALDAYSHYQRAWAQLKRHATPGWSDEMLAWQVRAALRTAPARERWPMVLQAIDAMSASEQRDSAWQYWKARALQATAQGAEADARRAEATQLLEAVASPLHFYGQLALEDLGRRPQLPELPAALLPEEREAAGSHPGLRRALQMLGLGLRSEGAREWNFHLRGQSDRSLLAAAALACERELWDRCINTSDRTRTEVDVRQRYPTPLRQQVLAQTREVGVDPAYVYGLIRQESRFVMDARSTVGASGLMQVMPATARWTARKIGLEFNNGMLTDRDVNLRLGTSYLKLALDDFGGSQAMAAAAYNAGPNRPRRWREGTTLDAAAWAENIPFNETRDYVKKVLANATVYAAVLGQNAPSLKARLGATIGPREASAPPSNTELP